MRRPSVRLLALIAILPALFLLSPPRASYACTAEYPEPYIESRTYNVPTLPEGVEVFTSPSAISGALKKTGIGGFTYEGRYSIRGDVNLTGPGFMAVTNLSAEPVYVLARQDEYEYWAWPNSTAVAPSSNVPDGYLPVFTVNNAEGLWFSDWNGVASGYIDPMSQPIDDNTPDFVNDTVVRLYHDGQMIEIGVTYIFAYNHEYASRSATLDKAMEECQRMMEQGFSETVTPTPPYQLDDPASPASQLIVPTIVLVGGLAITGFALWLWQSRRAKGE